MDLHRTVRSIGLLCTAITTLKVMVTRVTLTNRPDAVLAGNTSTFTCVTSASKPQACIRGYIQSGGNVRELDPPADCNQDARSVNITTRILTITASAEENGAELYCNASNSVTDPPVRSQLHILNVQYPPQNGVLLSGYVNNTAVESGETLSLTCQVGKGNPRPALSWSSECGHTNPVPGNDGCQQISISITASPSLNQKTCVCKGSQDGALTGWTEQASTTFNVTSPDVPTTNLVSLAGPLAGGISGAIVVLALVLTGVVILLRGRIGIFGKAKGMFHSKSAKPEGHRAVDTYANAVFGGDEVMHSNSGDVKHLEQPSRPGQMGGPHARAYTDVDFTGATPIIHPANNPTTYASIAFGEVGPPVQTDPDDERDGQP